MSEFWLGVWNRDYWSGVFVGFPIGVGVACFFWCWVMSRDYLDVYRRSDEHLDWLRKTFNKQQDQADWWKNQ